KQTVRWSGECRYEGTIKPEFIRKIIIRKGDVDRLAPVKKKLQELEIEVWTIQKNNLELKRVF
ncbi:MAG: hypothetical protein ABIF92_01265, partial [archaeon]